MSYYSRSHRPRRSRFSVTFADGSRKVILAYTAQGAVDHYRRLGKRVVGVVKGDYRIDAQRAEGGWKLDRAAYREALDFLGIKWPVEIKVTSREGSRHGAHRLACVRGVVVHRITVKDYLTPEQAGKTLWHELTHAMQSERCAAKVAADCGWDERHMPISARMEAWRETDEREGSYRTRPIEVEARKYEAYNEALPLAVAR